MAVGVAEGVEDEVEVGGEIKRLERLQIARTRQRIVREASDGIYSDIPDGIQVYWGDRAIGVTQIIGLEICLCHRRALSHVRHDRLESLLSRDLAHHGTLYRDEDQLGVDSQSPPR